jgi:hypothetical protein
MNPSDDFRYYIPQNAIEYTQQVLQEYSKLDSPNEGLVYWAGKTNSNKVEVLMVIAPHTKSAPLKVEVSNKFNFPVVRMLNANSLKYIGLVHSHPTDWVDHSDGDNECAPFRSDGIISIVVPNYSKNGLLPLTTCGIHRYSNGKFGRLSDAYVSKHFKVVNNVESKSFDLRNEY